MALSGIIGGLALSLAPPGAEAVGSLGAEHAIATIIENPHTIEGLRHVTLGGTGAATD